MCGIFGVIHAQESGISPEKTEKIISGLCKLSESRGKEASGIALLTEENIYVTKYAIPASEMIKRREYKEIFNFISSKNPSQDTEQNTNTVGVIGHSRLVTNGGQQVHANNQPAISSGMAAIHNGIITNVDELWKQFSSMKRQTELDTEILLCLIRNFYSENESIISAMQKAFNIIEGVVSTAIFFEDLNCFVIATNNGSLYISSIEENKSYIFASERYFLETLLRNERLSGYSVEQITPGTGFLINLDTLQKERFLLTSERNDNRLKVQKLNITREIIDVSPEDEVNRSSDRIPGKGPYILSASFKDEYPERNEIVDNLRRCTKCILPETMPFIDFDEQGECNYCRHYKGISPKGLDALDERLTTYRNKEKGKPDCLVALSGGRDSTYTVHILKNVMGMTPVTYTYDWGMVTDLARRNQMRICGKLGLEHILVSADIEKKRNNIRKNVLAWLKRPVLGTVPLFMAGDKQYFYYANKIAKQMDIDVNIFGDNMFESTLFKTGFCGISPNHNDSHAYSIPFFNQLKLAWYYMYNALANPAYINSSIIDSVGAYLSYYFIPHNYVNIFEYIRWDEKEITETIIDNYNWETDPGTTSSWRIGDGTAAFYNYIYYMLGGLTENDTFRSNQIREGVLTREKALQLAKIENEPRYDSMQWYCDVIDINFYETINKINSAPTLYEE